MNRVYTYKSYKGEIFLAYEIIDKKLLVYVYKAETKKRLFSITNNNIKSSDSSCAYVDNYLKNEWGKFVEKYGLAKETGQREYQRIGDSYIYEYRFDISKMIHISDINDSISFISVKEIKDSNSSYHREKVNRWGLTESQTKDALRGVHHSDEVEEAIEWYKIDHNIR